MKSSSVALIMAGGSGTRFWPLSQKSLPKQFLSLLDNKSLIQQTVERIGALIPQERIFICTLESHKKTLQNQLPQIKNLIFEPLGRNTAACLMLSVVELLRQGNSPLTPMVVLPSDHYVGNPPKFCDLIQTAISLASDSKGLVTLGIFPSCAHSGYGYIEVDKKVVGQKEEVFTVRKFIEKPDASKAAEFLRGRICYWNSGIFVWTLEAISGAFERWMPEQWTKMKAYRTSDELSDIYHRLPPTPIDIGVLEKADNVFMIPANIDWSDLGSWNALYELKVGKDNNVLCLSGHLKSSKTQRCLVNVPEGKMVALVGVEDLIVVESEGRLLITHRSEDQSVRDIAKEFEG